MFHVSWHTQFWSYYIMTAFDNESLSYADPADIAANKWKAICSYLGILILIPLLLGGDSAFAKFHAKQGLNVFLLYLISGVVSYIPFLPFDGLISGIAYFSAIIFSIIGIINVLQGKMSSLPFIGHIRIL
ncbi:MAG: hypothetical protein RLZZ578_899 [Bacteroidota bacterium]|jgi:uncharacterized membrane protein